MKITTETTHWMWQDDNFKWRRGCGMQGYLPSVFAYSQTTCDACRREAFQYLQRIREGIKTWDAVGQAQLFYGTI